MRIALGVEYSGSNFLGWQVQPGLRTVQGVLEEALSLMANCPVSVVCAGRTDTGVHGICQVVHFDTFAERDAYAWVFGSNANLDCDVTVLWAKRVASDFHARFSAKKRLYRYYIMNRKTRPGLLSGRVSWDYRVLGVVAMQEAANYLRGQHDFSSFRGAGCQAKTPVREIYRLEVNETDGIVCVEVEANGFLYHMVRNIIGVLSDVGAGKHPPAWAHEVLLARKRSRASITASAAGLYLVGVSYPKYHGLPELDSGGWSALLA